MSCTHRHEFKSATFGTVQAVEINGILHFIGTEVAAKLGYAIPKLAVRDHVDAKYKTKVPIAQVRQLFEVCNLHTSRSGHGGARFAIIINEFGFYEMAFGSNMPIAIAFREWMFEEVLPSIRKTGGESVVLDGARLREFKRENGISAGNFLKHLGEQLA